MTVKLLTEHHLEFLSLKRGSTGSPDPTRIKMPHCWKSCVTAQLYENVETHISVFLHISLKILE